MKDNLIKLIKKSNDSLIIAYCIFYLTWFTYLEKTTTDSYTILHSRFDDFIPFSEYFIIPYLFWFLYVSIPLFILFFKDKNIFYDFFISLAIGMTSALLICHIFPNGTDFRPYINPNKNIFSYIVSLIYKIDTNTNVFPSIHVYNSIATHIAISKSKIFNNTIKKSSFVIMILICMSTVFLKQHSVIDVMGSTILFYLTYIFIYENKLILSSKEKVLIEKTI